VTWPASDEEREFREVLRRFLALASPPAEVRRLMDSDAGWDEGLWERMRAELGLPGLAVPEAQGGQGFGAVELGLAQGELGRALACAPFFGSAVLAGRAAAHAALGAARDELLAAVAAGERLALAWVEPGRGWDPADLEMQARRRGSGWQLDGCKSLVVDGHTARRILVAAREPETRGLAGIGLYEVDGAAPGLARRRLDTVDRTRALARLEFSGVSARRVGEPGVAGPGLARALDEATALLAAEAMGGLERVLEAASEHARTRVQFGRPIGTFQAVKHKCADVLIALEAGRSAVREALEAADAGDPELATLASIAKAWCGEAFVRGAEENVQIHGGVGFTWEYDAHLHLRRALASRELLGGTEVHHERIARSLEPGARPA
jgi:alkylation response protein AidB-like acyl-CoA dehydrogenase